MRTVDMPRVDAEAGKNYYFNFFAEMGMLQPTMRFTPMSEDEGRKAVTKSKRAETMTY